MSEQAAAVVTPPPATPETPVQPPIESAYPSSAVMRPEDDPNHRMAVMIANRGKKKTAAEEAKPAVKEGEKPAETPPDAKPKLNDLIAKALKFTPPKEKPVEKKEELNPEAKVEAKPDEKPVVAAEETPKPDKTIVKAKKAAAEPVDTAKLVSDAAASAATAAVRAMQPAKDPEPAAKPRVEDDLKDEDRQEYLVAKHLGEINPKYKGAEKVVLEHIKKSEEYASRWEAQNQGKVFDPNDDEHNAFFEALDKPWTDRDFRDAEIDLKAEEVVSRKLKAREDKNGEKLEKLELENAKVELAPAVEKQILSAADMLTKAVGDDVFESIKTNGFTKFEESDPVTAAVLTESLGNLQPIIETIIQIDDPKGRFKIDPKNPLHQQWNNILVQGESLCAGRADEQGRKFATRQQYSKMSDAERQNHWYLTPEHLVQGVVDWTAKTAADIIKKEKEKISKAALAMGFVPKEQVKPKTDATKEEKPVAEEKPASTVVKPVSPTVGSGAKIDESAVKQKSGNAKTMELMSNILFKRG